MYNLRYHIASLVSVFFALALGLILGGLIVQQGTFDGQSSALLEGLRDDFAKLREDNSTLEATNEHLGALTTNFVDSWSAGRLTERTIVVVVNAGRQEGLAPAREAIEGAAGAVATVTLLEPGLGLEDEELRSVVTSLADDPDQPLESICAQLAAEWLAPDGERPVTTALVDAGIITVTGLEDGTAASGLVTIAAPEGTADAAGIALAQAADDAETVAIGAQTTEVDTGVAAAAADADLAAFDTLGTEVGRYTLVALLSGAESGYFGTASSAEALFPPVALL